MKITNEKDIALPMAIWLLNDEYDYVNEKHYISVTTLMRPIKQILLPYRIPKESRMMDVSELIASRMGTALHDSIEKAIVHNTPKALKLLGYPDKIIAKVLVNPTEGQLLEVTDPIVLWTEQRKLKKVGKWTVGGKFDLVAEGTVQDYKSTSAYAWVYGGRDDEHSMQLSFYKWLNPNIITNNLGVINYVFTDWMKSTAAQNTKYPPSRLMSKNVPLKEPSEIQAYTEKKLNLLEKLWDAPESAMPDCTNEELWMSESKYKYYSNPAKTDGRSSANFDTLLEANTHKATKGVGIVITTPGEPKRCGYCPAYDVCKQKDRYFNLP